MAERLKRGLIEVYTGNGKGKTTAALGLALRAIGWGFKVDFIQFLKGGGFTGEIEGAELLRPNLTITQFGSGRFIMNGGPTETERDLAHKALERVRKDFSTLEYDLVILDEVSHAINKGVVELSEVMELLKEKPAQVELVLTGRDMPPEIIEAADLVTEMVAVKHPLEEGVAARQGIEY